MDRADFVSEGGSCTGNNTSGGPNNERYVETPADRESKWRVIPFSGGWRLQHATSTYCVDVPGGSGHSGEDLQTYPCHNGGAQSFKIGTDGSLKHGSYGFDVEGGNNGSTIVGRNVQLYGCKGSTDPARFNQQWHSRGALETFSSKCLDIRNGVIADGTDVRIGSCDGGTNQTFDDHPYWY